MSAIAIHNWLQGPRNYAAGLALLKGLSTVEGADIDETDIWFLELGETSVSKAQLVEELQAAHARTLRARAVVNESAGERLVTKAEELEGSKRHVRDITRDGYLNVVLPPQLKELHNNIREWSREMNYLRFPERFEKLATNAERLRDGLRILELDEWIVSGYARLDAWKTTGRDPVADVVAAPRNGAQLAQRLKTVESYLSRHRTKKRVASPTKVATWEKERDELKQLIDALLA